MIEGYDRIRQFSESINVPNLQQTSVLAYLVLATWSAVAAPVPLKKKSAEPEPAWMVAFRKVYELKKDEYVKRVAPPYIPERVDFKLHGLSGGKKNPPEIEAANRASERKYSLFSNLFAEQDDDRLMYNYSVSSAGLIDRPQNQQGLNLLTVAEITSYVTGLDEPDFLIDAASKADPLFAKGNKTVHGDFVVRRNAPLDKLAPQLEKILRDECGLDVTLKVVKEEHDVYVVGGKYKLEPPPWRTKNILDIYATEGGLNKEYDHFDHKKGGEILDRVRSSEYGAKPLGFLRFVGGRVQARMVVETELPDDAKITFHNHTRLEPTEAQKVEDVDPALVLPNITQQTGLTFTKAKRKVPVLYVAAGKK